MYCFAMAGEVLCLHVSDPNAPAPAALLRHAKQSAERAAEASGTTSTSVVIVMDSNTQFLEAVALRGVWAQSYHTLVRVQGGPFDGVQALGTGSNKTVRERVAHLALSLVCFARAAPPADVGGWYPGLFGEEVAVLLQRLAILRPIVDVHGRWPLEACEAPSVEAPPAKDPAYRGLDLRAYAREDPDEAQKNRSLQRMSETMDACDVPIAKRWLHVLPKTGPCITRSSAAGQLRYPLPRELHPDDTRFGKEKALRQICCDGCGDWFHGDNVGAFLVSPTVLVIRRKAAWQAGYWDATWYCLACHRRPRETDDDVMARKGFTDRMQKKARYAKEGKTNLAACSEGSCLPTRPVFSAVRPPGGEGMWRSRQQERRHQEEFRQQERRHQKELREAKFRLPKHRKALGGWREHYELRDLRRSSAGGATTGSRRQGC